MSLNSLKEYLREPVDNTSLLIFRLAFGLLLAAEAFGAIMTGWVRRVFIEPEFTFTFIGFEWLQPLPGYGMYGYYILMGIAGLMVLTGYYYRFGLGIFTIMWWCVYLMQKTSYNNHYYLLILLCFLMLLVPAHRNASIDVRTGRVPAATTCPRWCIEIFKLQLLIVFTYAALAKLYPGWLNGDFISTSFSAKSHYPVIGDLLQQEWLQQLVIYGGIVYDLTIIPMLYWSRTRKFGVVFSIVFHLFNSVVFGIGIFPYLMLGSMALFFPMKQWSSKIPGYVTVPTTSYHHTPPILFPLLLVYFIWQLWLPVRHYFIPGDVFLTEEGHRMAWRMMLRTKYGRINYKLVDKNSGKSWIVDPKDYLTQKQSRKLAARPDMIWQFAQYLGRKHAAQGSDLEIYVNTNAYLNGNKLPPVIKPDVDLLSVKFKRFGHNQWISIDN